jgi:hypothetical protein
MLIEDIILIEANVEPKGLDLLDKFIHEMGDDLEDTNPGTNHTAFLKRLKKDIVNNNRISGELTALVPYKPKKTDPDFIKNATEEVYTVNPKALEHLRDELFELFIPDEGDDTPTALFNKFHELVKSPDGLDPNIANKLLPIKKKYEQGKFDLPGLKNAMQVMTQLGAQKWKHDSVERQRLETEAPIIMKFKNGMKWVRLDSQEEMKREGDMMQNCISGYCPVGDGVDLTFGLRDIFNAEFELEDQSEDAVYDWLVIWLDENDTDVQDFLMNKVDDLTGDASLAVEDVLGMDEEEAFDWLAQQIINADADIETGELTSGHLIYSLRDKNGESHIAAEYDPNVDMNYIEPEEALGKQNEPPVEKYKPYIEKLNDFFMEHPETFGPAGNTKDMAFHPDYDDDREHDESVNEGDLIPNPVNTVAIKTMSDGDFYNLSKYMGDLDKASPEEFGMPDSAAVITFQDEEEMNLVLKRIKKHTGMQGHDISGHDDPGDSKTWGDKKGFKKNQGSDDEPLSLVGKKLDRMKNLAGKPHERRFDDHIERLKHLAGI